MIAMSLVLGKDESVVRDDEGVLYLGGSIRFSNPMFGRLLLTNKRFAFVEQKTVESGPFFSKKKELQTVGIRINVAVDKVIGAAMEIRTRKKGTLNSPPTLMSKEQYNVLIVSVDTDQGVDNPVFQVGDTAGWSTAIQRTTGGESV